MYKDAEPQPAGNLKFGNFYLNKNQFAAMDGMGEHAFQFNEGVSLVVECDTQAEIDLYWNTLTEKAYFSQSYNWYVSHNPFVYNDVSILQIV